VDSWVEVSRASVPTSQARLLIEFSATTDCVGRGPTCPLRELVNGAELGRIENFDDIAQRPEFRGLSAVTDGVLSDGSHTVTVEVFTTNGTSFFFENRLLKVTV
jgi:hypothetical protein